MPSLFSRRRQTIEKRPDYNVFKGNADRFPPGNRIKTKKWGIYQM